MRHLTHLSWQGFHSVSGGKKKPLKAPKKKDVDYDSVSVLYISFIWLFGWTRVATFFILHTPLPYWALPAKVRYRGWTTAEFRGRNFFLKFLDFQYKSN